MRTVVFFVVLSLLWWSSFCSVSRLLMHQASFPAFPFITCVLSFLLKKSFPLRWQNHPPCHIADASVKLFLAWWKVSSPSCTLLQTPCTEEQKHEKDHLFWTPTLQSINPTAGSSCAPVPATVPAPRKLKQRYVKTQRARSVSQKEPRNKFSLSGKIQSAYHQDNL